MRAKFKIASRRADRRRSTLDTATPRDDATDIARTNVKEILRARATELRECEAKYAQEMRTQAQRVLGQRTLMAQQYLIGLEAVKHTSAGTQPLQWIERRAVAFRSPSTSRRASILPWIWTCSCSKVLEAATSRSYRS